MCTNPLLYSVLLIATKYGKTTVLRLNATEFSHLFRLASDIQISVQITEINFRRLTLVLYFKNVQLALKTWNNYDSFRILCIQFWGGIMPQKNLYTILQLSSSISLKQIIILLKYKTNVSPRKLIFVHLHWNLNNWRETIKAVKLSRIELQNWILKLILKRR